ncbi:hypothetical protein G5I_09784 [Acromyrmex echinatior]|uniref:Uncharacterized protein n=1 Tax=Acromyrmex echinatior TaxID=103372 RepID=F4WVB7_ACREC|nr:hypothetical protein G5I_09784 [Acromyrmex echinatior]
MFLTTIRAIHSACSSESLVAERLVLPQKETVLLAAKRKSNCHSISFLSFHTSSFVIFSTGQTGHIENEIVQHKIKETKKQCALLGLVCACRIRLDTPKFRGDRRYSSVEFRGIDMASSRLIEAAKRQMGQKLSMGTPGPMRAVQLFHIGNRKLSVLSNPFVSTTGELFPCMYGEYASRNSTIPTEIILMSGHLRLQQVQEMGVYLDKILSLLGRGNKEHRMRVSRANAQRDVLRNGEESNRISGYALRVFRKLKFTTGGLILIDWDTQSSRRKDLDPGSNPRQCPTTFRIVEGIGRERNSPLKDAAPPTPRDSTAKRCELKLPARRLSRDTLCINTVNGRLQQKKSRQLSGLRNDVVRRGVALYLRASSSPPRRQREKGLRISLRFSAGSNDAGDDNDNDDTMVPSERCSPTAFFPLPLLRRVPALSARMEIRSASHFSSFSRAIRCERARYIRGLMKE